MISRTTLRQCFNGTGSNWNRDIPGTDRPRSPRVCLEWFDLGLLINQFQLGLLSNSVLVGIVLVEMDGTVPKSLDTKSTIFEEK